MVAYELHELNGEKAQGVEILVAEMNKKKLYSKIFREKGEQILLIFLSILTRPPLHILLFLSFRIFLIFFIFIFKFCCSIFMWSYGFFLEPDRIENSAQFVKLSSCL